MITEKQILKELDKLCEGLKGGTSRRSGGVAPLPDHGHADDKVDRARAGSKAKERVGTNPDLGKNMQRGNNPDPKQPEEKESKVWPELIPVIEMMGAKRLIIGTEEQNQKAEKYFATHHVPVPASYIAYDPSVYQDNFNKVITNPGATQSQVESVMMCFEPIKKTDHGKKLLRMLDAKRKCAKLASDREKRHLNKY